MDAPRCRLCSKEHWPREGCKFDARHPAACPDCLVKDTLIAELRSEVRKHSAANAANNANAVNRTVYMREYMRARRAKQRAAP